MMTAELDQKLTAIAFKLEGEDRFLVLEAVSELRRTRREAQRAIEALRLI